MADNYIGQAPALVPELLTNAGRRLQVVSHVRGDLVTVSGVTPIDDTIPQIAEGSEILTVTLTPKAVGSTIRLVAQAGILMDATTAHIALAVHRAGQADALAATLFTVALTNNFAQMTAQADLVTASLSPITFSVRIGTAAGATVRINGAAAGRLLGGCYSTFLKAEEYGQ